MNTLEKIQQIVSAKGIAPVDLALNVSAMSDGRTTLLEELNEKELNLLLKCYAPKPNINDYVTHLEIEDEKKRLRSIVLKIATKIGVHNPESWEPFNQFMLKSSILHKPLKDYDLEELKELVKQFKSMERKEEAYRKVAGSKPWYRQLGGKPSEN
ncbi:hypothetical protein EDM00_11525 [Ornithobacterium rhinotracheale]|uniref:hypothetical protein n=1 Tax=Ornithobacterium rhinotracheale TaxID=28251 RepID=UPI00129CB231|nr:hypothetical protein [Ornithobacterium rhinotracheale]MRI64609.1 hypothetical protein [Ornithobacterium rhinotracheale]